MKNYSRAVCSLGVLALVAPAFGTVTLNFVPQNSLIPAVSGTTNVEVRADFTNDIIGFGLDLNVGNPGVASLIGLSIGPLWDPALATIDGDLFGGTSLAGVAAGSNILLATLTFQGNSVGVTPISLSVTPDPDEGFEKSDLTGQDTVVFANGTVTVLPEPASLALLGLGRLVALRRR